MSQRTGTTPTSSITHKDLPKKKPVARSLEGATRTGPESVEPSEKKGLHARSKGSMANNERTFIAVKPDGVQRGLVGKIIARFEERGYKLVGMKMMHASRPHLEVHYQELKDKPFFKDLMNYVSSGPMVAMVWEGLDVVKQGRLMLGATNPLASNPGTIRGDYSIQTGRNIVHGSDSLESAAREVAHWFKPEELCEWTPANVNWVYE